MRQTVGRWALAVTLLDLALKTIPLGADRVLVPGLLALRQVGNHGVAFGLMQGLSVLVLPLTALLVLLGGLWLQKQAMGRFEAMAYGLLLGGAMGNLVDRLVHGFVTDYLELVFVRFAVFNLADAALTLGAALLIVFYLIPQRRPAHAHSDKNRLR